MAECRAGESPDQITTETHQSEYQGFVKFISGSQNIAHKSNTRVLNEPIRDLKGGGGGGRGNGACTLHEGTGSCPFPAFPRPLNFSSGSTCRLLCPCPCHPVECPSVKCPPKPLELCLLGLHKQDREVCPPGPVESCLPGIHKQYRDVYSDCRDSHLAISYRYCIENDDLYLPYSPPQSPSCCNILVSSSCSPPSTPPPTQRCNCCQSPQLPEPNPCLKSYFQKVEPCSSEPLVCPPEVDHCPPPPPKNCPDEVKSNCFPTPSKYTKSPFPDQVNAWSFPNCPAIAPWQDRVDPSRSPPLPKRMVLLDRCCFPNSPKNPPSPKKPPSTNQVNSSEPLFNYTWPPPKQQDNCCFPNSPKKPSSPKNPSTNQVNSSEPLFNYTWPPPKQQDDCCFPISTECLTLPTRSKSSRLALAKVDSLPPKLDPLSFPKRVIRLAMAAQTNPPSPKSLAFPARASGGMKAEHNMIPEPPEVSVKDCADSDQKPSSKSLNPVQRIYVSLPYPAYSSLPGSPNLLPSLSKPLSSNDEKKHTNFTVRPELSALPVSFPPPTLQSQCRECIFQMPTSGNPNYNESLEIVKTPRSRSMSPMKSNIKSTLNLKTSGVMHLVNSSCQYSPRTDPERPKVLQSQKSGPSPPISPPYPDPLSNPSPCPQQRRPSPYPPPRPTGSHLQQPVIELPKLSRAISPLRGPLITQSLPVAEVVPEEKHVKCNCGPRMATILHDSAALDQSSGRRSVSPSLYEAIGRLLCQQNPPPISWSLLPEISGLAPCPKRMNQCTCSKKFETRTIQLYNATQIRSRSQSPSHSSHSTAEFRRMENAKITKYLNDVKQVLKKDFPSRIRSAGKKQDLKRDFHLSARSALTSEVPFEDFSSSIKKSQELPLSPKTANQKQDLKRDFHLSARSAEVPFEDFSSSMKRSQEFPSSPRTANQKQDLKRDFHLSARSALSELPFEDSSTSVRKNQEFPSSPRTPNQKQELSSEIFLSMVRSTLKPEFPSSSISGRTTDRKQDHKQDKIQDQEQEIISPRNHCKQEFWSSVRPKERKEEYVSCVGTTERGCSPIIGKPVMINSGTNGPGMESIDRPKTAPIVTSMNSEPHSKPKLLQRGHDHIDNATKLKPSTSTLYEDNQTEDSSKGRRSPAEDIPEASNSKHPSRRNFNKGVKSSREPRTAPDRACRRCCCGMCNSTYSRSYLTTKYPYCGNVQSCCCGMCSCPFPSCSSKRPIVDSESSVSTTTAGNGRLPVCNPHHPGYSRPTSSSPFARRSYVAGSYLLQDKHGPRSNSSRHRCKSRQKERQPSPRALLKSFNAYLDSQCRRSPTGWTSKKRCSHSHRRSQHRHAPTVSPERNCSRRSKRSMIRQTQRGLQQAPWGTHPIVLSSKPVISRFYMDQIPQPRMYSSGPHRGCRCPRCAYG